MAVFEKPLGTTKNERWQVDQVNGGLTQPDLSQWVGG